MNDTELKQSNPLEKAKVKSWFDPTPASQKWLDEHPEEAAKAVGYVPQTFIPFPKFESNLTKPVLGYKKESETMSDQPAEKTDTLNDAIGHWLADPEEQKKYAGQCRTKMVKVKLYQLYFGTNMKAAKPVIDNQWIPAMLGVEQGQPWTTSPFDSWITAEPHADAWVKKMVENAPKKETASHDHVFETAKCKVCDTHWSKVDALRTKFWVETKAFAKKLNVPEKDQEQMIHECLGVKHLEDSDLNCEKAIEETTGTLEAVRLDECVDETWKVIGPEFKTVRSDITDKDQFAKLVLGIVGFPTMAKAILSMGYAAVMQKWNTGKDTLKPATPKNGTNGNGHTSKPPSNDFPPPPVYNYPPEPETKSVPPITTALTINSPELAALEAKKQEAAILIKSGLLPKDVNTPEKVIVLGMMAEALGINKMVAFNGINIVQGKPAVSPQLMMGLIRRSKFMESFSCIDDGKACTVKMKRVNEPEHVEMFTQEDAQKMGLATKDNWVKQPATMRKWRAISAAARVVFPDVLWGLASYTPEEMDPDAPVEAEFVEQ